MAAVRHKVKAGECLSSIAKHYHFRNWRTIYDHPDNEAFRKKRPNPNMIVRGDIIIIPEKKVKEESGATEKRNVFKIKAPKTILRIALQSREWQPLQIQKYSLTIDQKNYAVEKDGQGKDGIEEVIPADAGEGELTVWFEEPGRVRRYRWHLQIGHLDPVSELTGVQARLRNLGVPGPDAVTPGGEGEAEFKVQLKTFQKRAGLEPSGERDARTLEELAKRHDRKQN
jgi:hypothetical protein